MLKKSELTEFKTALLGLQSRIRGDVQQLTREALDRNDGGGDSKSPTHIAELGTQTFEQDFSSASRKAIRTSFLRSMPLSAASKPERSAPA